MAEVCRDIDQGLDALNRKIDELNKRLRELEQKQKQCCDNNDNNDNNNSNNLEKRVKELEKTSDLLKKSTVETLNNFADIENTSREFTEAFQGLYEMVTPVIETVSALAEFMGGD